MNIPLVTRLQGIGVSTGPLVGNEDKIDDYGYRIWLEWCRNAVVTTKAESQKDSADIFGEAKPLLSDWLSEVTRDEIIAAMMALPTESQPAAGVRVNGIQYDLSTAAQRNTWRTDNLDRILYGAATTELGHRPRDLAGQRGRHRRQVHGGQPVAAQACGDGRQSAHSAVQDPRRVMSITSPLPA